MSYASDSIKVAARAVLDSLPDDASWEDIQYHLYVRQQIEAGLRDDAEGRLITTEEMRTRLAEHKLRSTGTKN